MKQTGLRSIVLATAVIGLLHVPAAAQVTSAGEVPNAGEAAAWAPISANGSAAQLKAFLDKYPNGSFAPLARQKYSFAAKTTLPAGVKTINVRFPEEARGAAGDIGPRRVVKLSILVQPDGKAGDVSVAQTSGFDPYDGAAKEAARTAIYLPALNSGMTVESRLSYDVSFGFLCNRAAGDTTCDDGKYPTTCSSTVCQLMLR
jgi:TonB family protein